MTLGDFIRRVVDDGAEAAREDYAGRGGLFDTMLSGSLEGLSRCRDAAPADLAHLLAGARWERERAVGGDESDYWYKRCVELEIEWVCNVVSAALKDANQPTIIEPTARGVLKASEILRPAA